MASAEQDHWVEICAAARAGIAKQVELIPAMNAGEVSSLMSAIDTALWNEAKAASYDETIAERKSDLERKAAFGG